MQEQQGGHAERPQQQDRPAERSLAGIDNRTDDHERADEQRDRADHRRVVHALVPVPLHPAVTHAHGDGSPSGAEPTSRTRTPDWLPTSERANQPSTMTSTANGRTAAHISRCRRRCSRVIASPPIWRTHGGAGRATPRLRREAATPGHVTKRLAVLHRLAGPSAKDTPLRSAGRSRRTARRAPR